MFDKRILYSDFQFPFAPDELFIYLSFAVPTHYVNRAMRDVSILSPKSKRKSRRREAAKRQIKIDFRREIHCRIGMTMSSFSFVVPATEHYSFSVAPKSCLAAMFLAATSNISPS